MHWTEAGEAVSGFIEEWFAHQQCNCICLVFVSYPFSEPRQVRPFQDWGMVCAPSYAAPSCNWLHYSIFVLRKSWQMWQISRIYPCEWNNRPLHWVWALLHVRKFTFSNSEAWRMANIILFKAPVSAPLLEEYLSDNLLMPGTARHSAEKTHHVQTWGCTGRQLC